MPLVIRDWKLVSTKAVTYSDFGPEAIKEHRLRAENRLVNNNPEDYMEDSNLFDEPTESQTQLTTNESE